MNFQIKNSLVLKTLKTFYLEYYKILVQYISNSLKNYLGDEFTIALNKNDYNITILTDLLFLKTTNLTSDTADTIQKCNPKILIFLPLKIKNTKYNKNKYAYYILGEIPKYTAGKTLLINGLKKTFISKLMFSSTGLFFNSFIKNSSLIVYAKIICYKTLLFNIILEDNRCFLLVNNYKYDLICLLYLLGLSVADILAYSRYANSFYLKKILLCGNLDIPTIINDNLFNSLLFFFNISFKLNTYYTFEKILNKNTLVVRNFFYHTNKFIALDFIAILDTLLDIRYKKKALTELDLLESRSISSLGNYLALQYSFFLNKSYNILRKDITKCVSSLVGNRNVTYFKSNAYFSLKNYLSMNPLVQYLEQINSFSELIHKNRVTNYNPKLKQNLQVRNINLGQLGSLCLVDTTEGINCGLVISFTRNIKVENKNNIQFPYFPLINQKSKSFAKFMNSFTQKTSFILFNNFYLRKNRVFNFFYLGLNKGSFKFKNITLQNCAYVNPADLFSHAENLIPFLFYNDPARGLMGAKMQGQAVPILKNKKSFILTGYEKKLGTSNVAVKTYQEGIVVYVSSYKIIIRDIYNRKIIYYLDKYKRSNYFTLIHSKPNVWPGERVSCGQPLTSTQDILFSEFTAGNNLLVSYGNFFGYNFEDAIVINKRLVYSQLFSSLHFKVYDIIFSSSNQHAFEVSTLNSPKKNSFSARNLDIFGIIKEGVKVLNNDILVSKIYVSDLKLASLPLFNLISILFGQEIRNIKDKSIIIPVGGSGKVVKTEVFSFLNNISSYVGYYLKCRIYICKQRLLSVGDKLCGRYGNKGVVAYISHSNDLPYSNIGMIPDIITDSLGIPSRMNIGQLLENLFGLSCYFSNTRLCITNIFNLPKFYFKALIYNYLKKLKDRTGNLCLYNSYLPGQTLLRDGRTGYKIAEPSFLGLSKYSKLIHMVKDKVHYRTIGPYTEIMQQPVKGRSKLGGQRFGEMEMWAIEAYGSSYNLRELLNYKSDDISARSSFSSTLTLNTKLGNITIPEGLRNLIREIHSMNLNIEAFSSLDQIDGQLLPININF